jgi:hypothetical protein
MNTRVLTNKAKRVGKFLLPPAVIYLLKWLGGQYEKASGVYYSLKGFNHAAAQKFELDFGVYYMKEKGQFASAYASWEQAKQEGAGSATAYERINSHHDNFFRDKAEFDAFCEKTKGKRCMEIGSATEGVLVLMPWIKDRILIDPLIIKYRDAQLEHAGKTFLVDIDLRGQIAETVIPEYVGTVDGAIVCRNTLDHTADPWTIIENMATYAAPGCALLLWSDIWLLRPVDVGHRNITKNPQEMEDKLKALGFDIVRTLPHIEDRPTIQYGCVAVKK